MKINWLCLIILLLLMPEICCAASRSATVRVSATIEPLIEMSAQSFPEHHTLLADSNISCDDQNYDSFTPDIKINVISNSTAAYQFTEESIIISTDVQGKTIQNKNIIVSVKGRNKQVSKYQLSSEPNTRQYQITLSSAENNSVSNAAIIHTVSAL